MSRSCWIILWWGTEPSCGTEQVYWQGDRPECNWVTFILFLYYCRSTTCLRSILPPQHFLIISNFCKQVTPWTRGQITTGPHRDKQPFALTHTRLWWCLSSQFTSHVQLWTAGGGLLENPEWTHANTVRTCKLHTERNELKMMNEMYHLQHCFHAHRAQSHTNTCSRSQCNCSVGAVDSPVNPPCRVVTAPVTSSHLPSHWVSSDKETRSAMLAEVTA